MSRGRGGSVRDSSVILNLAGISTRDPYGRAGFMVGKTQCSLLLNSMKTPQSLYEQFRNKLKSNIRCCDTVLKREV